VHSIIIIIIIYYARNHITITKRVEKHKKLKKLLKTQKLETIKQITQQITRRIASHGTCWGQVRGSYGPIPPLNPPMGL